MRTESSLFSYRSIQKLITNGNFQIIVVIPVGERRDSVGPQTFSDTLFVGCVTEGERGTAPKSEQGHH